MSEKLCGEAEQGDEADREEHCFEAVSECPTSCFVLDELRHVHLTLGRLTSQAARSFTSHLIYVIPTYFLLTCASFFELYTSMANGKEATIHAIYSVLLVLHPTVLAFAFYTLRSEREKTWRVIPGFPLSHLPRRLRQQLVFFSSQLTHSAPAFTVAGFFSVHPAFILEMVGVMATYLSIMISFRGVQPPDAP
ncbi:uncharacterized protein LOC122268193 [Penaeus japonicus]|uniref:uncharacterized protein LOC122268193 n=1 Tax=Penaeus japonicus TaxID=27405 RepID=UPI001C7174DF|nr:uncharacterized protein LOC122268193 [Penaeus japonicus]